MRTNTILTWLLYALLGALIIGAGYKACQMKRSQALLDKEQEDLEQRNNNNLTYPQADSSASAGSSYGSSADSMTSTAKPSATTSAARNGIEYEDPVPTTGSKTVATTTKRTEAPTTKVITTVTKPTGKTANGPVVNTGKYMVITGAFRSVENAREELETLIHMGYLNAEVKKFPDGWARVIAYRNNSRAAADTQLEKLRAKGYSSAYIKAK